MKNLIIIIFSLLISIKAVLEMLNESLRLIKSCLIEIEEILVLIAKISSIFFYLLNQRLIGEKRKIKVL